jgi:hypothetical protein
MIQTKSAAFALAFAAAALVASGCGSSKSGSTSAGTASTPASATTPSTTPTVDTAPAKLASGAPLARAQWIAAGDAICQSTHAKLATLIAHTAAETKRDLGQVAIYYVAEAESLGKLVPPKPLMHDWERIVDDIHLYGEYAGSAVQDAAANHGTIPASKLASSSKLQAEVIAIATRDGFKQCSRTE